MTDFLLGATIAVLVVVGFGLVAILRRREVFDLMMAVQLLGTGGIGAMLLLGAATRMPAVLDVALILAVLAAFMAIAFVRAAMKRAHEAGAAPGSGGRP
ncbi:MrpF/PhaF family protein [Cupriavidus respiraculi]|uniref:Multiple resistance and pH regulation protein F n=1 Tax=Cupriavidus respiraculi TaxID=195930 RepID=A0ABN7YD87_9BURK|nr:MrpF/PhaF family protein [Cupriavidus respiraculi]CAG9171410.1 hypothetical protein LMG21510_01647 [Cupriavidus respiraculi]